MRRCRNHRTNGQNCCDPTQPTSTAKRTNCERTTHTALDEASKTTVAKNLADRPSVLNDARDLASGDLERVQKDMCADASLSMRESLQTKARSSRRRTEKIVRPTCTWALAGGAPAHRAGRW